MVLIHGSGVVRAGQWSRKLIINEDINTGSQVPYIQRAMEAGYGVIVLNTNLNEATINDTPRKIRVWFLCVCSNYTTHLNYIIKSKCKTVNTKT